MASEADKIWFRQNIGALESQYKGQIIAILNKKVIAHSHDFYEVSGSIINRPFIKHNFYWSFFFFNFLFLLNRVYAKIA